MKLVIFALLGVFLVNAVPLNDREVKHLLEELPKPVPFKEEEVIDVLHQIWAKVPLDEITDIIADYLVDDKDFRDLFKYMLSDEFKNTQLDIEKLPEMKALLQYFKSVGMDVYKWINMFHDLVGLPHIEEYVMLESRTMTGGIPGLIHDIRAALPLDDLYALYYEKLQTSPKFKEFVDHLENGELQSFVNALGRHEGFVKWLSRLQAKGVDFDQILEILGAIIGIKFPKPPPPPMSLFVHTAF